MDRRHYLSLVGVATSTALAGCTGSGGSAPTSGSEADSASDPGSGSSSTSATRTNTDDGSGRPATRYAVETVATGFEHPWAIAHLPDGRLLVTERAGRLTLVDRDSGDVTRVTGTPEVFARGQGGMLDVALHPRYPDRPWAYLTYSVARSDGTSTTAVGRGRLDVEGARLRAFERLHAAEPFVESAGHFGSRLAFDADERLYVTVGDRQFKDFGPDHTAQDLTTEHGVVLRFEADGTVPEDNPFVDSDALDTIFSYGHRNPQGLTVHPETGDLWESEYGEQDGDELNVLRPGANYGWPVADEGCTYGSGDPIGVSHGDRDDVVAPAYTWPCGSGGFPPGGMTFCSGKAFPAWEGQLFVGGLASRALGRFTVDGREATPAERLLTDRGWRVRTVTEAPDTGHLYIAVDAGDAPVVRLRPA
jgi:quinoprotein glucose dehydrogenase